MFISRKGIKNMELYVNSQVQTIRRVVVAILDIKSKEIQSNLNLSKSVVSRHLRGESCCPEIDIFIIEKVFGIKVKDYNIL